MMSTTLYKGEDALSTNMRVRTKVLRAKATEGGNNGARRNREEIIRQIFMKTKKRTILCMCK